jgi:hypothetical protein
MKTALLAIVVAVLMAGSGGVGYYFGNDNGLKQAQNIRTDFINQRLGGQGTDAAQGQRAGGQNASGTPQAQGQRGGVGTPGGQTGQGQFGQLGGLLAGRATANGSVKSVQGNTITVTQVDGSTSTVAVDDKTTIQKLANGAISDVQPGLNIIVTEQNNLKRVLVLPAQ